jgi:hypothetical protein
MDRDLSTTPVAFHMPPEIWHILFDELHFLIELHNLCLSFGDNTAKELDFNTTLTALRLTCRSWEPPARSRLFRYAKLDVSPGSSNNKIEAVARSDRLRFAVREVHLVYYCPTLDQHVDLDMLPNLLQQLGDGAGLRGWQADEIFCTQVVPNLLSLLSNVRIFNARHFHTQLSFNLPFGKALYELERGARKSWPRNNMSATRSINVCRPRMHDPLFLSLKVIFAQADRCLSQVTSLTLSLEFFSDLEEFGLLPPGSSEETQECKSPSNQSSQPRQWMSQLTKWDYYPTDGSMTMIKGLEVDNTSLHEETRARCLRFYRTAPSGAIAAMFKALINVSYIKLSCPEPITITSGLLFPARLTRLSLRYVKFNSIKTLLTAVRACEGLLLDLSLLECSLQGDWIDLYEYLANDSQGLLRRCSLIALRPTAPFILGMRTEPLRPDSTYTCYINGSYNVRDGSGGSSLNVYTDKRLETALYRLRDKVIQNGSPNLFLAMKQNNTLNQERWKELNSRKARYWGVSNLYVCKKREGN